MMTEPKVTSEQAAELARWVGMLPPKCSSVIHAGCNRPAEAYIRMVHNCNQIPWTVWPVCAAVIRTIGQNVIDGRSHCGICNTSMKPTDYRVTCGKVPTSLEESP